MLLSCDPRGSFPRWIHRGLIEGVRVHRARSVRLGSFRDGFIAASLKGGLGDWND